MARKVVLFSLAMVFVLAGFASAAQNVANTNQKGSLLIWPQIFNVFGYRTYISIGNDYPGEVWVKCYWVDQDQEIQDFMFRLTANQPVWFDAYSGEGDVMTVPPFMGEKGELKCWAVNAAGDKQIAFNHLYGNALIFDGVTSGFEYNAWSFTARGVNQGAAVGTGGKLQLTGNNGGYDACPQYLVENFLADYYTDDLPGNVGENRWPRLALVPCKQDLRQDRTPTCTKAKFDVWNENETKYTGAYRCIKCWYEGYLYALATPAPPYGYGFGGDKFTYQGLHTFMARFRVTGVASSVCNNRFRTPDTIYAPGKDKCTGGQVNSPVVGVRWHEIGFTGAPNMIITGSAPHHAGADGTGFVLWDTAGDFPEAPRN